MATQTINFDPEHIQYVLDSKDTDESFSARVRTLVDKGIEVEHNE